MKPRKTGRFVGNRRLILLAVLLLSLLCACGNDSRTETAKPTTVTAAVSRTAPSKAGSGTAGGSPKDAEGPATTAAVPKAVIPSPVLKASPTPAVPAAVSAPPVGPISGSGSSEKRENAPAVSADPTPTSAPETAPAALTEPESFPTPAPEPVIAAENTAFRPEEVPPFDGSAWCAVHGNVPYFTEDELCAVSYEHYGSLDSLGRCGTAAASIGTDLMPTEERGSIGQVKPTGWHTVKYDNVDGKYLYNRCHLIGYQLSGENANERNLITGTRYLNVSGMLPFENLVADYVKETDNHVLYRVTPVFEGDNLLASGVLMEAQSVEDGGDGVLFCVFCYNVQPGIRIDYATGDSSSDAAAREPERTGPPVKPEAPAETPAPVQPAETPSVSAPEEQTLTYILNTNTKKFHYPGCKSVSQMKESNKLEYTGTRDELIRQGWSPCGNCRP